MITHDTELKLQAYLDNELSEKESREIATWLSQDAEGRSRAAELTDLKALLTHNELELKLPESREFYWSKIERDIRQNSAQRLPAAGVSRLGWWWKILTPALGVAVLLIAGIPLLRLSTSPSQVGYLHEIETPLDETSAISFHSQSAGMTVVWVQSRDF